MGLRYEDNEGDEDMRGLIHIYCGEGKGKTTAAVGLAIRAAGAGKKVLFTQFLKNGKSSELKILESIEGIEILKGVPVEGFVKHFDEAKKQKVSGDSKKQLREVISRAGDYDMVIMDEIIPACAHGITEESDVADFIKNRPEKPELVLTGRHPSEALLSLADYVTEMQKCKHPYDCGVAAREGIEY